MPCKDPCEDPCEDLARPGKFQRPLLVELCSKSMPPQARLPSNMCYEHLPDTSWKLLAKFHRGKVPQKAVEDEHTRGTRALESTIEAIAQVCQLEYLFSL